MSLIKKRNLVAEKFDGERSLLFVIHKFIFHFFKISDNGNVYLIDRKSNVKHSSFTVTGDSKTKGSIFDVEICCFGIQKTIFVFDILFYNGLDIRGNKKYLLKKRLDLIDQLLPSFNSFNINHKILSKPYYNTISEITNEYPDIIKDGLIFTPLDEPYSMKTKWTSLFKWKPIELQTIDFYVVFHTNDETIWNLFVYNEFNENIPFEFKSEIKVIHNFFKFYFKRY